MLPAPTLQTEIQQNCLAAELTMVISSALNKLFHSLAARVAVCLVDLVPSAPAFGANLTRTNRVIEKHALNI